MEARKLFDCEFVFMDIVWQYEPLSSRELSERAEAALGWKRTTSYTVLKKLCDRGYLQNEHARVSSLVSRDSALNDEYRNHIKPIFRDDVASLLDAALSDKTLSDKEARALKRVIDAHRVK